MKNCFFQKILGLFILALFVASCGDNDITGGNTNTGGVCDPSISSIITNGTIPADLSSHNQTSRDIFSTYPAGAEVVARYVRPGGTGNGTNYAAAAGNVKSVLDGITDASPSKVYAVLIAPGTYDAREAIAMKDNVAIVGGVTECLGVASNPGNTILSGNKTHQVFSNSDITNTALLYGVTIADGSTTGDGGGMYNTNSFPTLTEVTLSGNAAANRGGGMYNSSSTPVLTEVTLSGNRAYTWGGGMYNGFSSPILNGVTLSGNTADWSGGGMYNASSSPVMTGVTLSGNRANHGGGMYNNNSSPVLTGVTLSGNTAGEGGGMYNWDSSPILTGVTLSGNGAEQGGGMYNNQSSPVVVNTILWGNSTEIVGSGSRIHYSLVAGVNNAVDPQLSPLANNGGGILTHAIPSTSSAVNQGLYVRRSGTTYYYSIDNNKWYSEPELTTTATPPTDAVDLTATDATGYPRTGRPDIGAYEAR